MQKKAEQKKQLSSVAIEDETTMNEIDCLPINEDDQDNTFRQTVFNPDQATPSNMISPQENRLVSQAISPREKQRPSVKTALGSQAKETLQYLNSVQQKLQLNGAPSDDLNFQCHRPKTNHTFINTLKQGDQKTTKDSF